MKETGSPRKKYALVRFAASFAYVGYFPIASGTVGSGAGLALAWFFPEALLTLVIIFSAVGFVICRASQTAFSDSDPHRFVLDEVAGMMVSVLWLPHEVVWYAAAFFLFRILDVWKPGPIGVIQRSPDPLSIMGDDVLAGIIVCGGLHLIAALL